MYTLFKGSVILISEANPVHVHTADKLGLLELEKLRKINYLTLRKYEYFVNFYFYLCINKKKS